MSKVLEDAFYNLYRKQGKSEAEARRLAEIAGEPPIGIQWGKPKAKPYAVKETKPKSQLTPAEVEARFYQVKRGGDAGPKIRMASTADDGELVELREDTGEVTGCIVAVNGRKVRRP